MSGTLVYPLPARAADNLKPWWNNGAVTAIQLDSPAPVGFIGDRQTFTGFATGGYLNPQSATITGTLSGISGLLSRFVQNFGVDLAGNFSFDMIATVNQDVIQIQQGGVNSNNTNPVKVLANWSPSRPIGSGISCLWQHDTQDPACFGLAGPGQTPPIAVLYNKMNSRQFMTVNCRNPDAVKWVRGGGLGVTRSMQFAPLNNAIGTYDGGATPWIAAYHSQSPAGSPNINNGKLGIHGMDNIISQFYANQISQTQAFTVVIAFNQTIASQTYGSAWIASGIPNNNNAVWHAVRWNQPSGVPMDANGTSPAANGGFYTAGNATALSNGNYTATAICDGAGNVVFRLNTTQTGSSAITPGTPFPMFTQALTYGGNNLVPGAGGNLPNGCPFNKIGSMQIWQGALTGSDLTNAETWVSASIQ